MSSGMDAKISQPDAMAWLPERASDWCSQTSFFQCRIRKFLHGRTNHCSLLWVLQMLVLHFNKFMAKQHGRSAHSAPTAKVWSSCVQSCSIPWTLLEFHAGIIQNRTSGENHPKWRERWWMMDFWGDTTWVWFDTLKETTVSMVSWSGCFYGITKGRSHSQL